MNTFTALYPGKCGECDGQIKPGDEITRRSNPDQFGSGDYIHALCPEAAELQPLLGQPCGRCFCVHAGEC